MAKNVATEASDPTEVRTMTQLLKVIGNELGWHVAWDDERPPWKARSAEVSKMKQAIKRIEKDKPKLKKKHTVENLLKAVEMLKREKQFIESPVYVVYAVERALAEDGEERKGRQATPPKTGDYETLRSALHEEVSKLRVHAPLAFTEDEAEKWLRVINRTPDAALVDCEKDWSEFAESKMVSHG